MNRGIYPKETRLPLRSKLLDWLIANPMQIAPAKQWKGMLNNLQSVRKEEILQAKLHYLAFINCITLEEPCKKSSLIEMTQFGLAMCSVTLKSYWDNAYRPSLAMKTYTDKVPKRIEKKARRFVEKADVCYQHPSLGYWIVRNNYEDIVTASPNWIVLDHKGKMLNSCWFPSALEAFDAMHQSIRKTLKDYGQARPNTYFDEHTFLGGSNYQEWFLCLFDWPLPYRDTHFKESNLLVHIRTTERIDTEGRLMLMVEEIQSPWHADIRKHGSADCIEKVGQNKLVADAPFAKEWHELAIKAVLTLAVKQNFDFIGFTTGKQQCDRWWNMKGLLNLYDIDIPKCLKTVSAQYGCATDWTTINTRRPAGRVRKTVEGEWIVQDANNQRLAPPVKSKDIALFFLNERSEKTLEKIPLFEVTAKLKQAVKAGKIPLYGW